MSAPEPPLPPGAAASHLRQGAFTGREDFRQLVRDALACAASEGWSELILCDASFEDWPLDERAVVDSLGAWAKTGRSMTFMARRYDEVQRRHARLVNWRGRWSHITTAWACPSAQVLEFPSVLWSPQWVLERHDTERCTGQCGSEPLRRLRSREVLSEWAKKSGPGFPASVLGL
ncbi:MAG: hypothetical protein ACKVOO_00440 [Burkholderiaceae bacterium]